MSDIVDKFQEELDKDRKEDEELSNKKEELNKKRILVEHHKYTNELERIKQNESDIEKIKKINVGIMNEEDILDIQKRNKIYLEGAKNGMLFLNESFRKYVPCWAGNIVLVGGRTGGGKSSATANLILSTMKQKNPSTGDNRKILCISVEEEPLAVYNRLTCLVRDYDYNEQDSFTDKQKQELIDFSGKWPKLGVTVIGEDGCGRTNTLEGIKTIFETLVLTKTYYDIVLIDYIQKITSSKTNPKAQPYDVLKSVMNVLDYYKNVYPAPIVVMSQLSSQKAGDPENELDFQDRLRGSKDLITPCTVALEMVPDVKNLKTRWYVRKNRYRGNTVGGWVDTAYDKGHFKPMTKEWEMAVAAKNETREWSNNIGKHVYEEKGE